MTDALFQLPFRIDGPLEVGVGLLLMALVCLALSHSDLLAYLLSLLVALYSFNLRALQEPHEEHIRYARRLLRFGVVFTCCVAALCLSVAYGLIENPPKAPLSEEDKALVEEIRDMSPAELQEAIHRRRESRTEDGPLDPRLRLR